MFRKYSDHAQFDVVHIGYIFEIGSAKNFFRASLAYNSKFTQHRFDCTEVILTSFRGQNKVQICQYFISRNFTLPTKKNFLLISTNFGEIINSVL